MTLPTEQTEAEAKRILEVAEVKARDMLALAEKASRDILAISGQPGQGGNILKELSDIKSSLAVNTSETSGIKQNIKEIKDDIKEIKNDFVNRREFDEALKVVREEISPLRKFVYAIVSIIGVILIGAGMKLLLK